MGFTVVQTAFGKASKYCLVGSGSEILPSNKDFHDCIEYNVEEHCTSNVKPEGGKQLFRLPGPDDDRWDITYDTSEHTPQGVRRPKSESKHDVMNPQHHANQVKAVDPLHNVCRWSRKTEDMLYRVTELVGDGLREQIALNKARMGTFFRRSQYLRRRYNRRYDKKSF